MRWIEDHPWALPLVIVGACLVFLAAMYAAIRLGGGFNG